MTERVAVFRTVREFHFGAEAAALAGAVVRGLGRRAAVIAGGRSARGSGALDTVEASLHEAGVAAAVFFTPAGEPTVAGVEEARAFAREHGADVIVGVGGGSALDTAKAAAGLFFSEHPVARHFSGQAPLPPRPLPWVGVPTTAGAGAEMTPNAVLTDEETNVKKSLRDWSWLAAAALVDPLLTRSCPPRVTAFSGMDAFVQAVESYTSRLATPLTEAVSLQAAAAVARGLLPAFRDGRDVEARTAVAWGASMAGMALANARLGAVHGFAHPVGTHLGLPHGLACAILLPAVVEYNMRAVGAKYARLAREIGAAAADASDEDAAAAFLEYVKKLNAALGIPARLGEAGLKPDMIDDIVAQTLPSGSLAANPVDVPEEDLRALLLQQL